MSVITIRALTLLSQMADAVELQRVFWGNDPESAIPAHMLYSLATNGGHVLGAFDGDRLIGLLVGFLGTDAAESDRPAMANLHIASKRMIVLPEYRGQGVGYRLKLAQRELALRQGIRLIVWTFDPLQATNAHLNIRKLGAISRQYLEDYYGTGPEGRLATLGSSDRLQAEWWVTNRRVEERLSGKRVGLRLSQYLDAETPIVNPTTVGEDDMPVPVGEVLRPAGSLALLEIPARFDAIVQQDAGLAQRWRRHTRELFENLLTRGYVVTDFLHEHFEGRERAFYLLSQTNAQFEQVDFSRN